MNKISSYLEQDHARCDSLYVQAVASVVARDWAQAAQRFAQFHGALMHHMAMEENVIFPAFEEALGTSTGPTHAMRQEHRLLRAILQRLGDSIEQCHVGAFSDHADTFRITMQQHNLKEEGILHPMVDRVLRGRHGDLVAAMAALNAAPPLAELPASA